MVIEERTIGQHKGQWDTEKEMWVLPPQYIGDLPKKKVFDTGIIHAIFDPMSNEYKTFLSDPRTTEMVNQQLEMSKTGIQFRKQVIEAVEADSVITEATATLILAVLTGWENEVA